MVEHVWVLTDEAPSRTCETKAVIGVFVSPDIARASLVSDYIIDPEIYNGIVWTTYHDEMIEGHTRNHDHCYLLTREEVQS